MPSRSGRDSQKCSESSGAAGAAAGAGRAPRTSTGHQGLKRGSGGQRRRGSPQGTAALPGPRGPLRAPRPRHPARPGAGGAGAPCRCRDTARGDGGGGDRGRAPQAPGTQDAPGASARYRGRGDPRPAACPPLTARSSPVRSFIAPRRRSARPPLGGGAGAAHARSPAERSGPRDSGSGQGGGAARGGVSRERRGAEGWHAWGYAGSGSHLEGSYRGVQQTLQPEGTRRRGLAARGGWDSSGAGQGPRRPWSWALEEP